MQFSRFKFLVIAFVALLQCFVPLIHAHAHDAGGQNHVHFHADAFSPQLLTAAATPEFTAPADASPAIGVSQEFKRDGFLLPVLGLMVVMFLAAAGVTRVAFPPRKQHVVLRTPFHGRPPATAPPKRAA